MSLTHDRVVLERDGPGSYKFKFQTSWGEISGRVRVGLEGPPTIVPRPTKSRPH